MSSLPTPSSPQPRPSVLGPTVVIIGSVSADEDLFIHGTLRGHLAAPDHCVRLEAEAHVDADVLARDVTMLGEATGKFTATEIVDIRNGARVQGQIAAPRLVLEEGGIVNAKVETRSVDAAVRVAQYRRQK
ncbi:polymer-forming cytoskeletal protein [Luteitalea sp.]|jgi:cytoskeletal protein CcmA (bactofilin family)|uniref:polymer-forming cytoskeletal protein n=1 Tax=Luteitalea sp. TaxID=2004800 RepID=UPI0037C7A61B